MTVTVLDLIQGLPNLVTDFKPEPVNELTHITIVTDVSNKLPTVSDFDINGRVLVTGKRGDVIKDWGNKTLDEIVDFEKHNLKIMWSNCEIVHGDEQSPFLPNLVVRVLSLDEEQDTVQFCALRNKYGASLTVSTFTKTN